MIGVFLYPGIPASRPFRALTNRLYTSIYLP